MRKLKVIIKPELEGGDTYWEFQNSLVARIGKILKNGFYSKDGAQAKAIFLKKGDPYIKMSLAHELGHVLIGHKFRMDEIGLYKIILSELIPRDIAIKTFKNELLSWRLSRSICKSEHWCEEHAIKALKTYGCFKELPQIKWERLKIIPLRRFRLEKKLEKILSSL